MAAAASKVPPGSKLCVDMFLWVVGGKGLLALGDCSLVLGNRLPSTAQVAGQQGAYLAHLLNNGVEPGEGGYTRPPPFHVVKRDRLQVADALFRMDAAPWICPHSEALTASPPLDQPSRAAVCDIRALQGAAAAAGGATPQAIARAMQECMRSFDEEQKAARDAGEAMEVRYWDRPFEFLSLGIMAYVGNEKALTQVEAFDIINLRITGTLAFALLEIGLYHQAGVPSQPHPDPL
ncbi:hypothetical protein VaNZ11_002538 [Volvox africanus]|uniref:Uncharacterized protein n=1 Tax=Volvox africanus TaxID=51714 RepID=A0ABQ5RS35_9CHLO|nr:hypothetical protein VaNZ11_002538 [Volvox africanus]